MKMECDYRRDYESPTVTRIVLYVCSFVCFVYEPVHNILVAVSGSAKCLRQLKEPGREVRFDWEAPKASKNLLDLEPPPPRPPYSVW